MVKRNRGEILNIMKIAKVLEVSIDELVENTDMNISGDITGIKSGLETIRAITTTLKSKPARKGLIPLLTFDIMSQSLLKDLLKNASEVQGYLIPNVPDADFIVQMPGQAMSPKYEPGDMLICKYRETGVLIEPGMPYVCELKGGQFYVRIVLLSPEDDVLRFVSPNPLYPEFEVKRSQILSMSKIVAKIRIE
jgi:hypothetical protein